MEIFFLGTGTSIPNSDHSPASLLVHTRDRRLLFDIGPGTLQRLHLAGILYGQVDQLLLTHLHPDHTLDLATLLLAFNYAPGAERTAPFRITGGLDLQDFFARLVALYPEVAPVGFELQFQQVHRDEFAIDGIRLRTAPTGHTDHSVGYRIEDGECSVVYSGDTSVRGALAELAAGADLLITECSFPSDWATEDHLNADMVGEIAQQAAVKTLAITHCYPPALAVDLAAQIRRRYDGQIILARDGQKLVL